MQAQISETIIKLQQKLVPSGPGVQKTTTLPAQGWSDEEVRKALADLQGMDHTRWEDGRVSGAVYHGGGELMKLQTEAFGMFTVANPIHPDVFPGVRKMEAEVVAMVCCMCCRIRGKSIDSSFRSCLCSMLPRALVVSPPAAAPSLF